MINNALSLLIIIEILIFRYSGIFSHEVLHVRAIVIQEHIFVSVCMFFYLVNLLKQILLLILIDISIVGASIVLRLIVDVVHHHLIREVEVAIVVVIARRLGLSELLLLIQLGHNLFGLEVRVERNKLLAHLGDHRNFLGKKFVQVSNVVLDVAPRLVHFV